jgi:hypothetical protein
VLNGQLVELPQAFRGCRFLPPQRPRFRDHFSPGVLRRSRLSVYDTPNSAHQIPGAEPKRTQPRGRHRQSLESRPERQQTAPALAGCSKTVAFGQGRGDVGRSLFAALLRAVRPEHFGTAAHRCQEIDSGAGDAVDVPL